MSYTIISVESRKGGVGKTTAALNLARLLLDREFVVLFLDIDITGTNVVDILDSSYWKEKTNVIKHNEKPLNLLEIYQNLFMCGKELPQWKISETNSNIAFSININKINVMGSQIYKGTDEKENNKNGNTSKLICNPSILFDELHTFWFVQYLQTLCENFAKKIKVENKKRVAVILDNSPGYVGINPAIQEWLTDIGPKRGKFLTVSSLDRQDIVSCSNSMDELHAMLSNKCSAAIKYTGAKNKKIEEISLNKPEERFFIRLATNQNNEDITFYLNDFTDNNKNGINYIDYPAKYQGLIINKVFNELKLPSFSFNFYKILKGNKTPGVLERIIGNDNFKKLFIYYDEYVNFQFSANLISRERKYKRDLPQKGLINYFEKILKRNLIKRKEQSLNIEGHFIFEDFYERIMSYQKTLEDLLAKLKIYNYQNIVRLIDIEWYPIMPFERLRQYFVELLSGIDYPIFDFEDYFEERKNKPNKNIDFIITRIKKKYGIDEMRFNEFKQFDKINYLNYAVIYMTLAPFSELGNEIIDEISEIFGFIIDIQSGRYNVKTNSRNLNFEFRDFLIEEQINEKEIEKFYEMRILRKLHLHHEDRNNVIINFYNSFCKAQLRVLDLDSDFEFLINVIKQVTLIDFNINEEEVLFPNIGDILNNVIVNKSVLYSTARKQVNRGFLSANYMLDFQEKLNEIVNIWEIKNEI
jgi:hypothetical protein